MNKCYFMSQDDWSHRAAICPTCHARLVSAALPYLFHLYKGAPVVVGNLICCYVCLSVSFLK